MKNHFKHNYTKYNYHVKNFKSLFRLINIKFYIFKLPERRKQSFCKPLVYGFFTFGTNFYDVKLRTSLIDYLSRVSLRGSLFVLKYPV